MLFITLTVTLTTWEYKHRIIPHPRLHQRPCDVAHAFVHARRHASVDTPRLAILADKLLILVEVGVSLWNLQRFVDGLVGYVQEQGLCVVKWLREWGKMHFLQGILKHLKQFVQSDWFLPVFIPHDKDTALNVCTTHAPGWIDPLECSRFRLYWNGMQASLQVVGLHLANWFRLYWNGMQASLQVVGLHLANRFRLYWNGMQASLQVVGLHLQIGFGCIGMVYTSIITSLWVVAWRHTCL